MSFRRMGHNEWGSPVARQRFSALPHSRLDQPAITCTRVLQPVKVRKTISTAVYLHPLGRVVRSEWCAHPAEAPNISLLDALVSTDSARANATTNTSKMPIFSQPDAPCVLNAYKMTIGKTSKIVLAIETIDLTKLLIRWLVRYSVFDCRLRSRSSLFARRYYDAVSTMCEHQEALTFRMMPGINLFNDSAAVPSQASSCVPNKIESSLR
jgi:hypothetical protein